MTITELDSYVYRPLEVILQAGTIYVAIRALENLTLFKNDASTRAERCAKEKAIEFSARYLNTYVDLDSPMYEYCHGPETQPKKKPLLCTVPVGDFTSDSLVFESDEDHKVFLKRIDGPWLKPMNELQCIASAFVHGVADELVGFEIIGRTFCNAVATDYDLICIGRSNSVHDYYEAIVKLYKIWAPRLAKAEKAAARDNLSKEILGMPDEGICAIGCKKF